MTAKPEISIRPLQLSDADAVQRYASDERVARMTTIPQPYPPDGGETFVKKAVKRTQTARRFTSASLPMGKWLELSTFVQSIMKT